MAREQAQSFLRVSHQKKILDAYSGFADIDQFAAVATLDQIAAKGYSLAIPLYVAGAKATDTGKQVDLVDALGDWRVAAAASDAAISDVVELLRSEVSA